MGAKLVLVPFQKNFPDAVYPRLFVAFSKMLFLGGRKGAGLEHATVMNMIHAHSSFTPKIESFKQKSKFPVWHFKGKRVH